MLWPIPEYDERDYRVSNGIWTIIKLGWIVIFTWIAMDYIVNGKGLSRQELREINQIKLQKQIDCVYAGGYDCSRYLR